MNENQFNRHQRVNDILVGRLERKLLTWLCGRMPVWVTPDILTFTAFAAGVIIAVSYALTKVSPNYLWIASLGFILHWFGDSLDGTLARYRNIERPRYGYFVDHSIDTLVEVLIGLGIGFSLYVRLDCALFALVAYLMMSVLVNIRTCVTGIFQISYGKIGPTELRLVIIVANTLFFFVENPVVGYVNGALTLCDLLALSIGISLILIFMVTTFRTALELRQSEE